MTLSLPLRTQSPRPKQVSCACRGIPCSHYGAWLSATPPRPVSRPIETEGTGSRGRLPVINQWLTVYGSGRRRTGGRARGTPPSHLTASRDWPVTATASKNEEASGVSSRSRLAGARPTGHGGRVSRGAVAGAAS